MRYHRALICGCLGRPQMVVLPEAHPHYGNKMQWIRDRFPETRNDGDCLARVISAAKALGIPVGPMPKLWRASEDFGWYQKECPGAMFYLGAG